MEQQTNYRTKIVLPMAPPDFRPRPPDVGNLMPPLPYRWSPDHYPNTESSWMVNSRPLDKRLIHRPTEDAALDNVLVFAIFEPLYIVTSDRGELKQSFRAAKQRAYRMHKKPEAAVTVASDPPVITGECANCSEPTTGNAHFCSGSCRRVWHYRVEAGPLVLV